jgi:mannose-6-phosphate isomerase-like protein (cupin superfamily)
MLGTLDGDEVDVAAGDMVWTGVDATHGFINGRVGRGRQGPLI